jgi:hypothetical protein
MVQNLRYHTFWRTIFLLAVEGIGFKFITEPLATSRIGGVD